MPAVLGFALAAAGATTAAAFVTSAIGSALVNIGLTVGLSLVGNVLLHGQSPTQKPSDGQQTVKQPVAPRPRSYGRVRVSGPLWWMDTNTLTPATLYQGIVLNHGQISRIVSYHIDENAVTVDGSGNVTTAPYSTYTGTKILSRLGATPETKYSEINTVFGVDQARGDGLATLLGLFPNPANSSDYTKVYPNTRPLMRATIEACLVWDPRDGTQSQSDPTTWKWSNNCALCILDFMWSLNGYAMAYDRFAANLDEWIAAANICDEQVPLLGGGTGARYALAGTYLLTDDPIDVMAHMLSACDGRVWQRRDGSMGISVGRFFPPTITLGIDDITSWAGLTYGQDTVSSIDGIRGQFMSPDHDYREHEAEPWPDAATVLSLSSTRTAALDLTWTPASAQARRLMKRAYMRARADWRGTIRTNMAALQAIDERFIHLTIPELGIDRNFEIDRFAFIRSPDAACELTVRSIDASIDEWDPSEEGTLEAGTFAYVSSFAKTGTTLDPIGEAGGKAFQTAVVFAGSSGAIAATPAGWSFIESLGPTGGVGLACWYKVLDGTEAATTFNSVSDPIVCALFSGIITPQVQQAAITVQVGSSFGSGSAQVDNASPPPYAWLTFACAGQNFSPTDYLQLFVISPKAAITADDQKTVQSGSFSADFKIIVYSTDSTPPAQEECYVGSNQNEWGMASFQLRDAS